MEGKATDKQDAISVLASRPGCLGIIGSFLSVILGFIRQLTRVLSELDYEYESRRRILGMPLVSVRFGFDTHLHAMRHARGVIAIGTKATGIVSFGLFMSRGLLAKGGVALGLGTVSLISLALISVSVFGLGIVSVSVFSIGYVAVGIFAIGYKSLGIVAIGKEVVGIICIGQKVNSLFPLQ